MPETPVPPAPAEDLTIDANPRTAARLFVVPAIVAGFIVLALTVWFLFSALTREGRSADAYLDDIRVSSGARRWQAAYELSRILESGEGTVRPDTAARVLVAFRAARADAEDPRLRRYLALALGRLKDRSSEADLAAALGDSDAETRIYSALALGQIGDRSATDALVGALGDPDSGVRKAAAYALGGVEDPRAAPGLREALHDDAVDVTWNAAVALARMDDPSGAEVLRSMADRSFVERASRSGDPSNHATILTTAIQALSMIQDHEALPALRRLAASDPDLKVRQAAIEALSRFPVTPGG